MWLALRTHRELAAPSGHVSVVCMLVPVLVFDRRLPAPNPAGFISLHTWINVCTLDLLVCLCKSTILKQRFPFLTGFRCPLICMVVLVLCREPLREAVSPYRGGQRRNKRSWLETSVWVNYLPQFLEQLSVTLAYFSKAHFECIKSNNWHAGQQMTVLKIICHLGSLFQF